MRPRGAAVLVLAVGCAAQSPDFVPLDSVEPTIAVDIRYAGADNFVGAPIEGYDTPTCLVTPRAARALQAAQRELAARRLGLLVFDCYRPQRAVDHFVRWAADLADQATKARHYPRVDKAKLFESGYIAARSSHSRGSAVDLTLVRRGEDGRPTPLDMGTAFDFFDPSSHGDAGDITPAQQRNRSILRGVMERSGFAHYPQEWWHFTLQAERYPSTYFDVPVRR
jgi:D-alanyl-D-alanine dipeptidase